MTLPFGLHVLTLTVRDAFGGVSSDTVALDVFHTTTLQVTVLGQNGGTGTVSVAPPGATCDNLAGDATCTYTYTNEPTVILVATPAGDTDFKGWSGACSGTLDARCPWRRAVMVTALFRHKNRAPVAAPGGPYTAFRNVGVAFDGSLSSDADGDVLRYAWDFGDGATGAGAAPTHAYAALGDYTVTLRGERRHARLVARDDRRARRQSAAPGLGRARPHRRARLARHPRGRGQRSRRRRAHLPVERGYDRPGQRSRPERRPSPGRSRSSP